MDTCVCCGQAVPEGKSFERSIKMDDGIQAQIASVEARCGRKCLNAFIAGMKKTAAAKTLRMKNGRGTKTATGKIG